MYLFALTKLFRSRSKKVEEEEDEVIDEDEEEEEEEEEEDECSLNRRATDDESDRVERKRRPSTRSNGKKYSGTLKRKFISDVVGLRENAFRIRVIVILVVQLLSEHRNERTDRRRWPGP